MRLTECSSCRSFLDEYTYLAGLSTQRGLQWFLPGFIHPSQALMILLLHLTSCTDIANEARLGSQQLVDRVFDLLGNRPQEGRVTWSSVEHAQSRGTSRKPHLIHELLAKLRQRVWQRAGWGNSTIQAQRGNLHQDSTRAIGAAHSKLCELPLADQSMKLEESFFADVDPMSTDFAHALNLKPYNDLLEQFLRPDHTA